MNNYFDTQALAIDTAFEYAQAKGYSVVHPDGCWAEHIAYETYRRYILPLVKGDKETKRTLVMVIYRMPSGKYELTHYIG